MNHSKGSVSAWSLLGRQRSHVLFVLSDAEPGHDAVFRQWYRGPFAQAVLRIPNVIGGRHYEQHHLDVSKGKHARLPYRYLGIYDIAIDGAHAAGPIIERIASMCAAERSAAKPATWLYYPASEKVGRQPSVTPQFLTLAFANSTAGKEAEFREWYATRHIRHALHVSALVSGQCFERTLYQQPGAMPAKFSTIAVYEQEGMPESLVDSFETLPASTFDFPMLDLAPNRFAEWVYAPL